MSAVTDMANRVKILLNEEVRFVDVISEHCKVVSGSAELPLENLARDVHQRFAKHLGHEDDRGSIECWDDKSYFGPDLLTWRSGILQAAEGPARMAGKVAETFFLFVEFAMKASKWQAEISPNPQQSVLGDNQVVLKLTSTIFEGAIELHSSGHSSLVEEPVQSSLESLLASSFQLVTIIYNRIKSCPPGQDLDALRKGSLELLSMIYWVADVFRRRIGRNTNGGHGQTSRSAAIRIVAMSVNNFVNLGKLSTSGGDSAVRLLNSSWKSITALLQVEEGRDAVASAVCIEDIIKYLISSALYELKRVLGIQHSDSLSKEARKHCILIKFFLVTAGKVSSFYPSKALTASRELLCCVSKLYACLVCKELDSQKDAKAGLADLVAPTALSLLHNLLREQCVTPDEKIHLLLDVTSRTEDVKLCPSLEDLDVFDQGSDVLNEIFCGKSSQNPAAATLRCGRAVLFLSVLTAACNYSPTLLSHLLSRLPWLLDEIVEEGLYELMTQEIFLPDTDTTDKNPVGRWRYQLMFPWISNAIKVFAVVTARYDDIWGDFESFLFNHVLHPCAMCGELVLDVWTFIIRQSSSQLARSHLSSLLLLLQSSASEAEETSLRRLARPLCGLLQDAPGDVAFISEAAFREPFDSRVSAKIVKLLLEERFPLSDGTLEHLIFDCVSCAKGFIDSFPSIERSDSVRFQINLQILALSCLPLLLSIRATRDDATANKHIKEITLLAQDLISLYAGDLSNNAQAFHTLGVISPILELIPHVQHLLDPKLFEVLLPRLLTLLSNPSLGSRRQDAKQPLAEFLANLSEIGFPEDESYPPMQALWGLYHSVLREKHWALVHMGLESFAHFADRTTFQEPWRFVPSDTGVVPSGNGDDDVFMAALGDFLEKRCALTSLDVPEQELEVLRRECKSQQQNLQKKQMHIRDLEGKQSNEYQGNPPQRKGAARMH